MPDSSLKLGGGTIAVDFHGNDVVFTINSGGMGLSAHINREKAAGIRDMLTLGLSSDIAKAALAVDAARKAGS